MEEKNTKPNTQQKKPTEIIQAKPEERVSTRKEEESDVIFIGKKPVMNYVLAVVTRLNASANEVVIKARGRSISRAVDVAEIVKNRFLVDSKVTDIKIGTELLTAEDGTNTKVSSIEIHISK